MTHEEATKNHSGGENSKPSAERETRLYSTGADDDAFASLKLFVAKINPSCTAFFQYPKSNVTREDTVWYENRPLGVNKLNEMMKIISVGAELSQIYTNHSVRASAITLLSDPNVPDRHIMFVSGHSNEQSLAHYSSRPSVTQLESVSDTISNAVENNQPQTTEISTFTKAPTKCLPTSPGRPALQVFQTACSTRAIFKETFRSFLAHRATLVTKSELQFRVFCITFLNFAVQLCFLFDFLFHGK